MDDLDNPEDLLWADKFRLLPREARVSFFDFVSQLSRETAAAEREAAIARAEADRLRQLAGRAAMVSKRDKIIRETIRADYSDQCLTTAAKELAGELARYAASGWLNEMKLSSLSPGTSDRRRRLHSILRWNSGRLLGWRRILDITR